MFATALIVFRETLEAALFVGVVAVATKGLAGRAVWLLAGIATGLAGALLLAAGSSYIGSWADGVGQDFVNAAILGLALLMLAWHCIWVSTQGQAMAQEAKQLGASARSGQRAPWALVVAVALAVLREGAETVLFVAGLAAGSDASAQSTAVAVLFGLFAGAVLGALLYLGLSRIKAHHLFPVTNTLILLLAAAIASQLARTLSQAGVLNLWSQSLWDSSSVLADNSPLGATLHALVGYTAQPSGLQLAFYVATLVIISAATRRVRSHLSRQRAGPDSAAVLSA